MDINLGGISKMQNIENNDYGNNEDSEFSKKHRGSKYNDALKDQNSVKENELFSKKRKTPASYSSNEFTEASCLEKEITSSVTNGDSKTTPEYKPQDKALTSQFFTEDERISHFFDEIQQISNYDIPLVLKNYSCKINLYGNKYEDYDLEKITMTYYKNFIKKIKILSQYLSIKKSSLEKNILLRFLEDFIRFVFLPFFNETPTCKKKFESNCRLLGKYKENGFDLEFFENIYSIAFFVSLKFCLIDESNSSQLLLSFVSNINKLNKFDYFLVFYLLDKMEKLNYPNTIKKFLSQFNSMLINLSLFKRNSKIHKQFQYLNRMNLMKTNEENLNLKSLCNFNCSKGDENLEVSKNEMIKEQINQEIKVQYYL